MDNSGPLVFTLDYKADPLPITEIQKKFLLPQILVKEWPKKGVQTVFSHFDPLRIEFDIKTFDIEVDGYDVTLPMVIHSNTSPRVEWFYVRGPNNDPFYGDPDFREESQIFTKIPFRISLWNSDTTGRVAPESLIEGKVSRTAVTVQNCRFRFFDTVNPEIHLDLDLSSFVFKKIYYSIIDFQSGEPRNALIPDRFQLPDNFHLSITLFNQSCFSGLYSRGQRHPGREFFPKEGVYLFSSMDIFEQKELDTVPDGKLASAVFNTVNSGFQLPFLLRYSLPEIVLINEIVRS